MTTIAYKDGIIAYDSLSTCGDMVVDDRKNKMYRRGGHKFFLCGEVTEIDAMMEDWPNLDGGRYNASGIVILPDGRVGEIYGGCERRKIVYQAGDPAAFGSGEDHAITAMDMGATAKEAVKMAAKRNIRTGGRIRTYKVS